MDLNNKRVLVVGLGKSGVASALFLKSRGARVTVSDSKPEAELRDEILLLLEHGITVETGGHGDRTFRGQDLIVVSPGVPLAHGTSGGAVGGRPGCTARVPTDRPAAMGSVVLHAWSAGRSSLHSPGARLTFGWAWTPIFGWFAPRECRARERISLS